MVVIDKIKTRPSVLVQAPRILRNRQLWQMSYREIAAADIAVIGTSIEPTPKGVSNALSVYGQILNETKRSFRRILRELAPVTTIGLAIGIALMASPPLGLTIVAGVAVTALLTSYFQAENDNSSRIFNAATSLQCLLSRMEPAVVRAGLQALKSADSGTYALIMDKKALSGEMGKAYGSQFIDFLQHFEA